MLALLRHYLGTCPPPVARRPPRDTGGHGIEATSGRQWHTNGERPREATGYLGRHRETTRATQREITGGKKPTPNNQLKHEEPLRDTTRYGRPRETPPKKQPTHEETQQEATGYHGRQRGTMGHHGGTRKQRQQPNITLPLLSRQSWFFLN